MKINLNGMKSGFYIPVVIGLIILAIAFSLAWFTFGYWLITLVLAYFFNFILPFSWDYALGGWLIALILGTFIIPFRINVNYK